MGVGIHVFGQVWIAPSVQWNRVTGLFLSFSTFSFSLFPVPPTLPWRHSQARVPRNFPPTGGDIRPASHSLSEHPPPRLVLPAQRLLPCSPGFRGCGEGQRERQGLTGPQVLFNVGRSFPALLLLCGLQAGFCGDFISSKLLIKFHIYGQKIKSLDLFETGFYEFWLWQLSQQSRACSV